MRLVLALGGNALLRRGEPAEAETQRARVREAASVLAALAAEHELVVTHGNGPQVGLLALEAASYPDVMPYPLDVLGAESQGMIGYLLVQALGAELPERELVAVLTRVLVAEDDPAFLRPTKPIGPSYTEDEAVRLAAEHGWAVAHDGACFRRIVASPEPREILELKTIRRLVDAGVIVVCAGGGGIPVVRESGLHGIEGVIDKDLTASLLARGLDAERLVILTDARHVECDWGLPSARPIVHATPDELRGLRFAAGSMGPKVEAACRFADLPGKTAAIGSLAELAAVVAGRAGTQVARRPAAVAAVL